MGLLIKGGTIGGAGAAGVVGLFAAEKKPRRRRLESVEPIGDGTTRIMMGDTTLIVMNPVVNLLKDLSTREALEEFETLASKVEGLRSLRIGAESEAAQKGLQRTARTRQGPHIPMFLIGYSSSSFAGRCIRGQPIARFFCRDVGTDMPKRSKELSAIEVKRLKEPGFHAVGGVPGLHPRVIEGEGRSWKAIFSTLKNFTGSTMEASDRSPCLSVTGYGH